MQMSVATRWMNREEALRDAQDAWASDIARWLAAGGEDETGARDLRRRGQDLGQDFDLHVKCVRRVLDAAEEVEGAKQVRARLTQAEKKLLDAQAERSRELDRLDQMLSDAQRERDEAQREAAGVQRAEHILESVHGREPKSITEGKAELAKLSQAGDRRAWAGVEGRLRELLAPLEEAGATSRLVRNIYRELTTNGHT